MVIFTARFIVCTIMKCIIFVRVSTSAQSFESQIQSLQEEAVRQDYPIESHIIIKNKESAISLKEEERRGLEELKSVILSTAEVSCLFTWEISRISRQPSQIFSIRDFLIEHNIRWINLEPYVEVIDKHGQQNQMSNILLHIFSSLSETETQIKKERAKRGIQHSREAGTIAGGAALRGYKINRKTKRYEVDPADSRFIKNVFKMYATAQYTYRSLAKELKERGYFPSTDIHSISGIIGGWLNDERYTGTSNRYPQIISPDLYNRCKEVMEIHRIKTNTANKRRLLCKGIIYSKITGYALIGYASRYHTHPDYKPSVSIQQNVLDRLVGDFTQMMMNKYYRNTDKIKIQLDKEEKVFIKKLATITYERLRAQEKLDRTAESYIEGKINKEKEQQLSAKYKDQISQAEQAETRLGEEFSKKKDFLNSLTPIEFLSLDFNDKRKYVLQVISKIEVYKSKPLCRTSEITIHCKLDDKKYVYLLSSNDGSYKLI